MKGNLQLFWEIASSSQDERLRSANELVEELLSQQAVLASTSKITLESATNEDGSDDQDDDAFGEADNVLYVSDEEAESVEETIGNRTVADLMYALRRLLRGLASPRESSRLGFAVVLTELLSRISYALTAREVLVLLLKYSNAENAASRQEKKDLAFAKLFGVMALVQSDLLFQSSSTLGVFKRCIRILIALSQDREWMSESCAWVMVSSFTRLKHTDHQLVWTKDAENWMTSQLSTTREVTPEKLAVLLTLGTGAGPEFYEKSSPALFRREHPLSTANLPQLAKVLREAIPSDKEDAPSGSRSRWQTQIHFVWDLVLDIYFADAPAEAKLSSVPDFFRVVVDESLFSPSSSTDRKSWGFQVFDRALPRAKDTDKPLLFTPNFLRTMISHLGSQDRLLHKAALKSTQTIRDVAASNPDLGFVLVTQLIGKNGHQNFDAITKTKTVEQTLAALDTERVRIYAKHLCDLICHDGQNADDDELDEVNTRRKWTFDQLLFLVRTHSIPKDDTLLVDILTFMAAFGYFEMLKPIKSQSLFGQLPKPAFNDDLRAVSRARFLSCVSELSSNTRVVTHPDGSSKRVQGVAEDGELWLGKAHGILSKLEADKHCKSIFDHDEEIAQKLSEGVKCLDKVRKLESRSTEHAVRERMRALETLLLSALLVSADAADGASDLVEPLCECADRLFSGTASKSSKKKHNKNSANEEASEDGPSGIDLLCDCLLGFLELPSAFLRATATHAFEVFTADMTRESMKLLLSHLQDEEADADEGEGDEEEDEEDDEKHVDMEDADAGKSTMSSAKSKLLLNGNDASMSGTSATSEDEDADTPGDSDDDDDEEDSDEGDEDESDIDETQVVDPELRARVEAILKGNGLADSDEDANAKDSKDSADDADVDADGASDAGSDSSIEFSDMDDDEMMLLDDKLAEVFRQRVSAIRGPKEAKREAIVLRLKTLDLVEIFARKQPQSALMLDFVQPLYELWSNRDQESVQLANKARELLTGRISKAKAVPEDIDPEQAAILLESMHREARDSQSHEVSTVTQSLNGYLTKAALAQDSNVKTALGGKLLETYRASLLDYLMRKACRLPHEFLIDAFRRFPLLGWHLRMDLLDNCRPSASAHAFRQLQAMQMLQAVLTQMAQRPEKEEVLTIVPDVVRCFSEIVNAAVSAEQQDASTAASFKPQRIKDVVKFVLQVARISKRIQPSPEKLQSLWKTPKLAEAAEKLQHADRFKSSSSIHDLTRQLLSIVSAKSETQKKGDAKGSKGQQQPSKKRPAQESEAGDASMSAKSPPKKVKAPKK
ncbi:hypothetical protein BCV70DRAFT_197003 [Testicularia cyperi]|uniref:DNA polymerase V n=1 Tax=Testicularia cyperi TaxID=1882483 RepID=A0A317XXC3_9BASI|nr:hypothetical protein BCV70DRAFT_197003 [Testicularia cyperi]